ncbi:MAG TPA: lytic transglycosylase [Alteromonas australica]|jgi:membrane-bound lytic murein transglycosylase D|uniref:Lytic transglycosylase n=1 Tax=Alteromonas australica TaxID=589873 RepID=A0A358E242_9ALTE|nr:LysM peptidoglycan-binding domain-containing protein [Alteromonas australica]MAB93208.1 lytic transglycosylase [Alteromonas sp.]MAF69812.1 lytic transglycosylase [Alteromonas sp.]MBU34479.1 lytic transglycosylase [Alteromonas sp.]HAW76533.1 lytic transglycosylase [Alteromonas australica]HBU52222.1 lytic transglycosylase [Alteromonas australica]|tara:strand:+ start:7421 stop:9082 length:1662 start_codon:yes stop_codon:yes gene_type:complete
MQLKFVLSPLVLAVGLSGCQITDEQTLESSTNDQALASCNELHTTEEAISDCEIARDGVIEVVHPNDALLDEAQEIVDTQNIETQAVITDVWQRVSDGLRFHIPDDKRVESQRNWYLKHPEYMKRVVTRAQPFLYYIVDEIEKRDMPMELVLLPIVESAFDPFAYSHGRAAGMWQFIPGTGKRFGMEQTWWYDGRRDVVASTQGALDYLTYLANMFDGNWLHALAAYNSGEGRVSKAIRANKKAGKPTDFWNLRLPRETRAYVPKLLALADILKNRDTYAYAWPEVENVAVIDIVDIGSQVDLAFAADLAGMSLKELHALNPGFNRWATSPEGPHRLVLPLDKASNFADALAKIDRNDRLNWVRYTVKSGDSLSEIASKYHTTVNVVKQVNELKSNTIRVGQAIMVPVALKALDAYSLSQGERLAATQNTKRSAHKITHTVKSGDTLWDIARKYKVSTKKLASWNGMAPNDMLKLGKTLVVWQDAPASKNSDAIIKQLTYTVRNGDSLSRIASKFNVRINDISKWNNINSKRYLQPGQKLKLFVDVTRLDSTG